MGQDQDKDFGLKPGVAIGYSLMCNLGGERQMTVQCFVDEAEPLDVVNARIDRVFQVMDRQKAKYDLANAEKDFEQTARVVRNMLNAIPQAAVGVKAQLETLKAELLGMEEARKEVYDEAYEAHTKAGRRGQFQPKGSLEGRLRNMDNEISKKKAAIEAAPNDVARHRADTLVSLAKYRADMVKQRAHINDMRHLAGLPAYDMFMDEQTAEV
jgi:hypothetical protein